MRARRSMLAAAASVRPQDRGRYASGGRGARLRAGEEPDDEADHRQDQDEQGPEHLRPGRGGAADDADNRPDIEDQDDDSEDELHGGTSSSPRRMIGHFNGRND